VFPRDENPTIPVQASWVKPLAFPNGNPALEIPLTLDPSPSGNDLLHVWTPEAVPISLRLPSGTIVNSSNAQSLGFEFGQEISDGSDPAGDDFGGIIEIGAAPGAHIVIEFPENQAAGTYHLLADTSAKTATIGGMAEWHSTSPLVAGCQTEAKLFRAGDAVTVVCVVAEEQSPVANVTLAGEIQPQIDVTASVALGTAQLIRKEDDGEGFSLYVYRLDLQNNSSLASRFIATAETSADDATIVRGEVGFDTIAAGQSGSSLNELQVSAPTTPGFDPATLNWRVVGAGNPIALALTDAGPGNDGLGDGIYSGQFTPSQLGTYSIRVELTGTSPALRPFYRVAITEIEVIEQPATIGATTDTGVDANGNGKHESIRINTSLNVNVAGEYVLNFSLADAQERQHGVSRVLSLELGSQLVSVEFPAAELLRAGLSNGPHAIRGMVLSRRVAGRETVSDYLPLVHTTGAYNLGDFDRGSIYFTGQASEQALNLDGVAGYEVLRVQAEAVQVPGVAAGTMNCRVQGKLTDAAGFVIDAVIGAAAMNEGTNQVALDFRGPKIARSNVNGPYAVRDVSLECSGMRDSAAALLSTAGYLAVDFQNVQPEFLIDLSGISLKPGETRAVPLTIRGIGAYEGAVTLSAPAASPGLTPAVDYPNVLVDSLTTVKLSAAAGTAPGSYSMELSATDGTITRTRTVPVLVSAADVDVEVLVTGPRYLHPGMSTQLTATVLNSTAQGVTWSIYPGAGSFVPSGNTATYTVGAVPAGNAETIQANSAVDPTRAGAVRFSVDPPIAITLTPAVQSVAAGQQAQIAASLANVGDTYNNDRVTWAVSPAGSTVSQAKSLTYTAPAFIGEAATVTVTATNPEDPAAMATATIHLIPTIQVSVSPASVTLRPGEVQSFAATVMHDPSNAGVSYTLSPQVGSIEANGLYSAPAAIAAPVNVTLTATSVADPARSATATIALLPAPNPRVTLAAPVTSLSIPAASSGTLLVNLTRVDGYAGEFTLSAAGLPAGVTATFFPKAASPASPAVLQLATGAEVATGAYPFTVVATADGETDSLAMTLNVIAMPEFTVTAVENVVATPPGSTVEIPLQVVYRTGWSSILVWNVAGLPPGATIAYDPPSHWATGAMRATVTTTAATPDRLCT
jgi:hypothetical protein